MGRDWSWLGGGKKKSSSKSKKDIKSTPPSSSPDENTATGTGCMSGVFNIFDLQHLQLPITNHHLHLPKGIDAEETPFSPTRKDGNLNISMGIKIRTKTQATSSPPSLAATESYSPSVKTPTLVARLMGLDLVPDNYTSSVTLSSPSSSSHTNKHRHYSLQRNSVDGGTRSLPETPRISFGRRSVDISSYQHQRSSLHLKEMKIHVGDKENRSPRDYARLIVMQLKENVSQRRRRMGTDITNKEQRPREVHEPKKASMVTVKVKDESRLQTEQEELQVGTEQGEKQSKSATKRKKGENFKSRLANPPNTMQEEPFVRSNNKINNKDSSNLLQQRKTEQVCNDEKQSKSAKKGENFKSRLVKPPQTIQEEPFVRSRNNIKNKDSSKLRETQSSRNRASSSKLATFQSQSQTHTSPITKRTFVLEETVTQSELRFENEGERIVRELERGIFESLVTETTTDCFDRWTKTAPLREMR